MTTRGGEALPDLAIASVPESQGVPSSTLIIYKRLDISVLPLHINEALAFKQRLEGKQWTCVSLQIRILTNHPLLCM